MESVASWLFSSNFMPHGMCFQWRPGVLWLHVVSDAFIVLAYLSIPVALICFLKRRRDLQFPWVFRLFAAFIFFCAMTHLMAMIVIWEPQYVAQGMVKLATAVVSMATAVLLWPLLPKALALPSPAQLAATNRRLASAVEQRRRVEQQLRESQALLEERIQARTAELSEANARLQAEIAEREDLEKSFASVIEAAPNAFVLVDEQGLITLVNQQAEAIFGYSRDELIGSSLHLLVPERYREGHHAFFSQYLRNPAARAMGLGRDLYARRKDGSEFPVEIGLASVETSAGRLIVSTIIDITERVLAEAQLRNLKEELEHKVRQRTAQLEGVVQELEAFSYSVSHDLRAPLRHICGFIDLLRDESAGARSEQGERYISLIDESAARMGHLIDDLLEFSRAGRVEMQLAPVDLRDVVDEIRRELEPDMKDRVIEWRIGGLPQVTADRGLIRIALTNLIANAVKFTAKKPKALIEIGSADDDCGDHTVFVRDNGAGFDMHYADKLFGVFQRLHRREEFEGTGIGLANVRRIVARHGGRTWAYGSPGQGATFHFSLPTRPEAIVESPDEHTQSADLVS